MSATSLWTVASAAAAIAIAVAACETTVGDSGVTGADTGDGAGGTDAGAGGRSNAGGATTSGGATGDGGAAACDPAADHSSDPLNCGACGHDCLGGECQTGQCQAVAIWTGHVSPPLFLDDLYVYWVDTIHAPEHGCPTVDLVRAPKLSAPLTRPPEIVAEEQGIGHWGNTIDAAVVEGNIYYGASRCHMPDGYVHTLPANAAAPLEETTVATFSFGANGVAVTSTTVYALPYHSSAIHQGIDVTAVQLAGGAQTVLATSDDDWSGLQTDGANLYWQDLTSGEILAMPTSGGVPQAVVPAALLPSALYFVDASGVYFTVSGDGLHQLPLGAVGGGVNLLKPEDAADGIYAAVPAGSDVCIADVGAQHSRVVCASKSGPPEQSGRALAVVDPPPQIAGLAGDDAAVYWATSGGDHDINTIYRVAK
jgi:hypothetical protein